MTSAFLLGLAIGFLPPFILLCVDVRITRDWQHPEVTRRQLRNDNIAWMVRNNLVVRRDDE